MSRPHPESPGFERTLKIVSSAQAASEAGRFAELAVSTCSSACREAVALAACELAENVAKYGVPHSDPRAGTISVGVQGNLVRVVVTNAASADDVRSVLAIVARIASAPSVAELYRGRLRELFANSKAPRAELGLLRLAFEGGFRLTATFQPPLLQIVAERPCRSG